MISRTEHGSDSQLFPEFVGELCYELGASIRYYFGWETMSVEYIILEKGCGLFRHYRFLTRGDDNPLGKSLVNYNID